MGRELILNVITRRNFRNHLAKPKPRGVWNQSPEWFNDMLQVTQLGEKARNSSSLVQDALYYIMVGKTGESLPNRRWMLSLKDNVPLSNRMVCLRDWAWGGRAIPPHCSHWWGITASRGKNLPHSSLARTHLHLSLASETKSYFVVPVLLWQEKQQQQQEKREPGFKN